MMSDTMPLNSAAQTKRAMPWHHRLIDTPLKCHALGLACVSSLILLNAWIWTHPASLCSDPMHTAQEIDEAMKLISSRDSLSNQHQAAQAVYERQQESIQTISNWLPQSRDWADVRSSLQVIAAQSDVRLASIDRGIEHVGVRVAVMETRCEVRGRYVDICHFLSLLAASKSPMWCDQIRITRSDDSTALDNQIIDPNLKQVMCQANLSIRIPFAGQGTTAEKLLSRSRVSANDT